jgi:hypothetical protein
MEIYILNLSSYIGVGGIAAGNGSCLARLRSPSFWSIAAKTAATSTQKLTLYPTSFCIIYPSFFLFSHPFPPSHFLPRPHTSTPPLHHASLPANLLSCTPFPPTSALSRAFLSSLTLLPTSEHCPFRWVWIETMLPITLTRAPHRLATANSR